jgi:heme a synthase
MMPNAPALYDFAPVLQLMLLGAVLAALPLGWVWLRNRKANASQRLKALVFVTLFLTFDLVLFGAFTRLTDSGLGCPDWPGCYGQASPVGAHVQISAEQAAMPTGPVTHSKAWIEMIHRYLASSVGVLIVVLLVGTWLQRKAASTGERKLGLWLPCVTLVWVCLQGAFGALTVTMKLFPAIVSLHLLGGMVLLALLQAQASGYSGVGKSTFSLNQRTRALAMLGFALLWLQIALGAWVSTNYAVLACAEFPMCQGQWLPDMNLQQGFSVWRPLGQLANGQSISLAGLTAIHVVHRVFAFVLFAVLGLLAWRLHRAGQQRSALAIVGLLAWQLCTGLANVVLGWPLLAAVSHTGGAAGLVLVMTNLLVMNSRGANSEVAATALPAQAAPLRAALTQPSNRLHQASAQAVS